MVRGYTNWTFDGSTVRMPEFTAPALGRKNNTVTIDFECGAVASGVLYALGGSSGGLTCYIDQGHLVFEYNLMIIDRTIAKSEDKIAPGKHTVIVSTTLKAPKPGAPADMVLSVDGKEVARTTVKMTVPAVFTASETFDVGLDLGSTVSRDYFERRPFKFDGTIGTVQVKLRGAPRGQWTHGNKSQSRCRGPLTRWHSPPCPRGKWRHTGSALDVSPGDSRTGAPRKTPWPARRPSPPEGRRGSYPSPGSGRPQSGS